MRGRWIKFLSAMALLAGATSSTAEPTPAAVTYLEQAIELIRLHHRYSGRADWPKIVAQAQSEIADAQTPQDTYRAIRNVLAALREPHSILVDPSMVPKRVQAAGAAEKDVGSAPAMPGWQLEANRFGLVSLPGLNTLGNQGSEVGSAYTAALRAGLSQMDQKDLCGWIIDLRQNGGGNMWPMLWGLDPLLGQSPFGNFVLSDGSKQSWVRARGNIFPTAETLMETPRSYALKHSDAPLAVLVGPGTASSGEMTAIAFIGRPNVRLIGSPTAGFTSANRVYPLSDGAFLLITETSVADRLGHIYEGPISPDEQVAPDQAKSAAIRWLSERCK